MKTIALTFIAVSTLLACQNGNTAPGGQTEQFQIVRAEFQKEFTIRVGQTAELASPRAHVSFLAVTADSRCPVDVQCVWEGDAALVLDLRVPGETAARDTLHTSPRGEGQSRSITLGKVRITLRSLVPQPKSGRSIRAEDYVATLMAEVVSE